MVRAPRACLLALLAACGAVAAAACECSKGEPSAYTTALRTGAKKAFWEPARYPLHNATAEYDFAAMKKAIAGGANVNQPDDRGYTPLHVVLMTTISPFWHRYSDDTATAMKLLLAAKANPNTPLPKHFTQTGMAPLHWIAYDGRADLAAMLLQAGADPSVKSASGSTPLHDAAACTYMNSYDPMAAATVKVLAAWGADLAAKDGSGLTPLDVTPSYKRGECKAKTRDARDCVQVCQVLKDGVDGGIKASIKGGALPDRPGASWAKPRSCCFT